MEYLRVCTENARRGAGPRDEPTDLIDDLRAASRPIDGRKLAREHGRIRRLRLVLRHALRCAVFNLRDGLGDRVCAEHSELFEQVLRRLVGADGLLFD